MKDEALQMVMSSLTAQTKVKREKAWDKWKKEHPHLVRLPEFGRDGTSEIQDALHMPDETMAIATVKGACPMCGHSVALFRIKLPSGKCVFQVGLRHNRRCKQHPIPETPVDSAPKAVIAWRLYVTLIKDL